MASSTMEESQLPGGYLVTPRVPQGLAAAVEGLTREVIRNAPEDIYVFAAHHFEKLLQIRERCGTEKDARESESSRRTVREFSQALRMREFDHYGPARTDSEHFGWSLNQTAKVLKRHRSIFGEAGRRISTDEVFQMADQKENLSQLGPQRRRNSKPETSDNLWKASTSRTDRSWSNEESPEIRRAGPRIITQIPNLQSSTGLLAKDIKTELRRNRISSRERRNDRSRPENRTSIDKIDGKTSTKGSGRNCLPKKSSERQKRPEAEAEKRYRQSEESSRPSKDRQQSRAILESRALSMDRVKDYVVQKFATTQSLEELQTLTYVEKVQSIIDETGPIIKGKVEELKSGMIGRSKRSSWFANAKADPQQGSSGLLSGEGSKDEVSRPRRSEMMSEHTVGVLEKRLTETQQLLENVSSKIGRPRRSRSARSSQRSITPKEEIDYEDLSPSGDGVLERRLARTKNQLENISSALSRPMRRSSSAKSLRRQEEIEEYAGDALKMRLDETKNLLEGISASFSTHGHRGRRGKSIGNAGTEDNICLESPNMSQVSLPVVRTISAKTSSGSVSRSDSDHLVLPAISPEVPKSKKVKEDLVLPILSPPGTGSSNTGSKNGEETDDFAEEDIPEIPVEDYEPELIVDEVFKDSLNVTPDFDSVPQRPDSLEPPEIAEEIEVKPDNLEKRLLEIQRVQKDIEKVFTTKKSDNKGHSDKHNSVVKKELLESENKIERISDSVACDGKKEMKASVKAVDESVESEKNAKNEVIGSRGNGSEVNERKEEEKEYNKSERTNKQVASPENLDYTYVLTEGSPYDIPDTVTTVIIPDRTQSPESEEEEMKLSPVFERPSKGAQRDGQSEDRSATNSNNIVSTSPKIRLHSKKDTNPFGELIEHDSMESVSPDINFIREMESRQEARLTHLDLVSINEEILEDLEPTEDNKESRKLPDGKESLEASTKLDGKIAEAIEKTENESADKTDALLIKDKIKIEVENAAKTPETVQAMEETRKDIIANVTKSPKIPKEIKSGGNLIKTPETIKAIEEIISTDKNSPEITEEIRKEISSKDTNSPKVTEERKNSGSLIKTPETIEAIEEIREEIILKDTQSPKITEEIANSHTLIKTPETIEALEEFREEIISKVTDSPKITEEIKNVDVRTLEIDDAMKTSKTTKEEMRETEISKLTEEIEDVEIRKVELDKNRAESELSPEASRPHLDSESSNEAKESSGIDEPLDSVKCTNSVDEEESSDSRSPESSNEVKETTLTDGISLSLDPTRPFVPDLNLDSLQDLTVSSFKMTEDEYDNQGHVESGNTNSITETLASDDNHRLIENAEEMEYFVSSSDRSKLEESGYGQEEIVEEEIVKSQVEIKEDLCVKRNAYLTGPSEKGECSVDGKITERLQNIQLGENEEIEILAEDVALKKSDGETSIDREITNISSAKSLDEKTEISDSIADDKSVAKSPAVVVKKKEEIQGATIEERETETTGSTEDDRSAEGKTEARIVSLEVKKKEEMKHDNSESLETSVTGVMDAGNDKMEDQTIPGGLNAEIQSVESDETMEESFVEEETPLAVSRSASQCTTRRVSSGNLARLREDPTLGWTEEIEQETATDNDGSASKVKFSIIGGETIKEHGSDELEPVSASVESVYDDNSGKLTKDSREYHIYVPKFDASDDKSATESSSVTSAVTKIQARVRGFLTRKRIYRGQHNRNSTLNSIPSIQDSIAGEYHCDDDNINGSGDKISSVLTFDEPGLENAATTIQNNFRAYKARSRLRREDAIQRTTLSLEKSFAESGLQHTGEFHDCIPLPIHDVTLKKKNPSLSDTKREPIAQRLTPESLVTDGITLTTVKDNPENSGQMYFGQSSSNMKLIQFGMTPNIGQLVDLVVQAKEEAELQSGYLNFITSVEDAETVPPEMIKTAFSDVNCPHESLKEPLALSVTPLGVVIEEISNSDAERYLNLAPETATVAPETESLNSERAPCASSETITESTDKNEIENSDSRASVTPETREAFGKDKENRSLPTKSSIERLGILECSSLPLGKDFLQESSVDSMECPVIGSGDKSSSRSSDPDEGLGKPFVSTELSANEKTVNVVRNSSKDELEFMKENPTSVSNEASSTLSLSINKVDDLLGEEKSPEIRVRKPILEVAMTPVVIMKSMSTSQESQLAGERIESPITMVQMAPTRTESLVLEESIVDEVRPTDKNSGKSGHDEPS